MKLAIVGSRSILDPKITHQAIKLFIAQSSRQVTEIVSGGATGVDTHAKDYALTYEIKFTPFYPDMSLYPPKIAPLARNTQIAAYCDEMLAVWDGHSRGTIDVMKKAHTLSKPVYIARTSALTSNVADMSIVPLSPKEVSFLD
jgi:hypothetical protein